MDPADITKKPQCADSVNITKNNQHMTTFVIIEIMC